MGGYVKRICGQWGYRIGVRWLWTEQHGREVLGRPKLIELLASKEKEEEDVIHTVHIIIIKTMTDKRTY